MSRLESAWCRSAPWRTFAQRVVLPWALQGTEPAGHALEIGSGSGAMAEQLLLRHPDLRVTVTDVDPAMVDAAAERLERFGGRAATEKVDATALPFPDDSFDLVLSFVMLHHVIDWEGALREAVRVVRPGGRVVGYDLVASTPFRLLHQVERAAQRMMRVAELRAFAASLDLDDASITPSLGGATVRFTLTTRG